MAISRFASSSVANGLPKYQKLWDQSTIYTPPAFESIATVLVGTGGIANIQFTSIPSTYKHLQLRLFLKADATTNGTPALVYNGDTSSVYTYHHLKGDGGGTSAYSPGGNYGGTWYINGGQSAGYFGMYITDILDYASTNKYKTIKTFAGFDNNGSGSIFLVSHAYMSTSAISSLNLTVQSGNISQYSHAALYGIRG